MFIGELGLCTFSEGQQKSVRLVNRDCKVPQVGRRLLRFLGMTHVQTHSHSFTQISLFSIVKNDEGQHVLDV